MRYLLLGLVVLAGCHIVSKDSYWEDAKLAKIGAEPEGLSEESAHFPFLGVRIPENPGEGELGAKVLHVFASSPAARAGLETLDEIRSIGGAPVRTAENLRGALRGVALVTSLVYARDGQEREINIALVRWSEYLKERRKRIFAEAAYSESSLPFFFDYVTRELPPEFVELYFGAQVKEPVLVYEDLDVFPLWTTGIGVWRRERLSIYASTRGQIVSWPMRWTTEQVDKTIDLGEIIPPPPKGTRDM
jgi:hypothetical protein